MPGGGDAQRANSWQNKVGALPGVALPVDVSTLPAKSGAAAPSTPAPSATGSTTDNQQAVIDTQAGLYFGPGAVSAGLADEVSDPQAAINAIATKYQQPRQKTSIQMQAAAMDLQTKM